MEEHFIDTTGFTVCKKCNRTYLGEILGCSCRKGSVISTVDNKLSEGGMGNVISDPISSTASTVTTSKGSSKKAIHKKGKYSHSNFLLFLLIFSSISFDSFFILS